MVDKPITFDVCFSKFKNSAPELYSSVGRFCIWACRIYLWWAFFMPGENVSSQGRVALFKMTSSLPSLLIAAATRSSITHCAIEHKGHWYDASEKRGDFCRLNPADYHNRRCYMISSVKVGDHVLPQLSGKKYDYFGVGTWLLGRVLGRDVAGVEKPYCFEVGHLALTGRWSNKPVSGRDLLDIADAQHLGVYYGKFDKLNESLRQ